MNLPRVPGLTTAEVKPPGGLVQRDGQGLNQLTGLGRDDNGPGENLVGKQLPAPGLQLVGRLSGRSNAGDIPIRLSRIASYVVDGVRTYKDLAH